MTAENNVKVLSSISMIVISNRIVKFADGTRYNDIDIAVYMKAMLHFHHNMKLKVHRGQLDFCIRLAGWKSTGQYDWH